MVHVIFLDMKSVTEKSKERKFQKGRSALDGGGGEADGVVELTLNVSKMGKQKMSELQLVRRSVEGGDEHCFREDRINCCCGILLLFCR